MVKLLLILCLIASVSFGADETNSSYPFFYNLILIFSKIFKEIQTDFFNRIKSVYISGTLSAMLTIVILIYATRKIREGTFEFPKDVIEIIIFLLMITFVNYCLHNYGNLKTIMNYLDIPADTISNVIKDKIDAGGTYKANTQKGMGYIIENLITNIYEMQTMMVGSTNSNILMASIIIMLKIILWLVYAWFAFILVASISMTYILTFLQEELWKMFGVIMIPLIYFKATRGMVIFWVKTIIALSLISAFMSIMAYLSLQSEVSIISTLGSEQKWEIDKGFGMSYVLIGTIIISKIILITFLKEIPTMINGMLGTSAGGSTGAFANSVAMGSIGAAGAGAGFAAFKGAMAGGKALGKAGDIGVGLAKTADNLTGNKISNTTSTLTGNVKKGISSVANSSIGQKATSVAQGAKNIWQGKGAFSKESPKTPPKQ